MDRDTILKVLGAEIERLKRARAILTEEDVRISGKLIEMPRKKRTMSAAGRRHIVEAQRKRWAKIRRVANG